MRRIGLLLLASSTLGLTSLARAQWVNYPDARIPRLADGKANLAAPAPRTADGKPDLSGVWQFSLGMAYSLNIVADLKPTEVDRAADALFRRRMAGLGADDSSLVGCLPRGPRFILGSGVATQFVKIEQKPNVILVLSEELAYRQIFMDGRPLPADPSPSFMGYSVGRWEGDTLVVDSNGFNDRTWLDFGGHPHTEALRITERFRRTSVGKMELEVTLADPGAYARSWTVPVNVALAPDTELLEFVCNEQLYRRLAIGLTDAQRAITVPLSVLTEYVGSYETRAANPQVRRFTVRLDGDSLVVDLEGRGSIPVVPVSQSTFSIRFINFEFLRDASGTVTRLRNVQNGFTWDKASP